MRRIPKFIDRQPIAQKLAWLIAGTTAFGLFLMSSAVIVYELISYPAAKRVELETIADIVGTNSKGALLFRDAKRAAETLQAFHATRPVTLAVIRDDTGQVFASYEREPGHPPGVRDIVVERSIAFDGKPAGSIRVVAEFDEVYARLKRYLALVATILAVIMLLVVAVTTRVRRLISEPLLSLARAARELSQHNYSVRAVKHSEDEIGVLTDAFNNMVQEVSARTRSLLDANTELEVARHRADAASMAKARFLANMSHEIRTPMNGIMGTIALALDTPLNREQIEYLRTVQDSADSLLSLLDGILDFSKIEAGKLQLEETDFEVRATVESVHRLLAVSAHQKGLEIVWRLDPAIPPVLRGDPMRLGQILTNLIGNAIKFTDSGEVVTEGDLVSSDDGLLIRFSVSDTGIGISPNQQARVLEPFEQVDGSTTRVFGGTGLGLSICRRLAELMGGRLSLQSTPGEGSTFSFNAHFPVATGALPEDGRAPVGFNGERVLVVEDNRTNRRVVMEILERAGLSVTVAGNALEALGLVSAAPPEGFAVILSDTHMPGMDGFRLAQTLCSETKTTAACILMLTGLDLADSTMRCRDLGIAGYVIKPVAERLLLETIDKALHPGRASGTGANPAVGLAGTPVERAGTILVAEDNLVNQRVVASLLRKKNHRVTVVANGAEAVAQVLAGSFDLVLMDLQMPVMDGLCATMEIRRSERNQGRRRTPIIALSAHAFADDAAACIEAGMDAYLSKPVKPQQLWEAVATALHRGEDGWRGSVQFVATDEP